MSGTRTGNFITQKYRGVILFSIGKCIVINQNKRNDAVTSHGKNTTPPCIHILPAGGTLCFLTGHNCLGFLSVCLLT